MFIKGCVSPVYERYSIGMFRHDIILWDISAPEEAVR